MQHGDGKAVFTANLMHPQDEDPELRLSHLQDLEPSQLEPPGISDIKRCELFNKLCPFLRPEGNHENRSKFVLVLVLFYLLLFFAYVQ